MADLPQAPVASPGAAQAAGAQQSQQPPMGSSPASQPTPNRGHEAAGLQALGVIVMGLERALPMFGAGTEIGKDVLKALQALTKHLPPGSVSPAAKQNELQKMQMANMQNAQNVQAVRQSAAAPPGGGGGAPQAQAA